MTTNELDRLDRIEGKLDAFIAEARADRELFSQRIEQIDRRIEAEVKRWDERFFQFARDATATARTVIIAAGAAVVFGPLVRAFEPAIEAIVTRLVSGSGS